MKMSDKLAEALGVAIIRKRPTPDQTYHGRTVAGIGIDPLAGAFVVGSEPSGIGPLPAPGYSADPGQEPPLGQDVNAVPDMETEPYGGSALVGPQDE